jgi:hypothetical protein
VPAAQRQTAKISLKASNYRRGVRTLIPILLMSILAFPQATPAKPPANLNDSDNARKARALLDQAVQALGGEAYLTYKNRVEEGRYYPLYHGRTNTPGVDYHYYVQYPDKDRFEVLATRDIHVIPGAIDIGGIKSKKAVVVLIHNGLKGYETTYKGTVAQDKEELANYLRRRPHSLEWVFRKWMNDPNVALFYEGVANVDAKIADKVSLLNRRNDGVTIFLDQNTHLPLKTSYSWRDATDKQRNVEEEIYDNYKPVEGIMTPHSITRKFNGDMSQQRFITTIRYNLDLPESMFEATVDYDPMSPTRR